MEIEQPINDKVKEYCHYCVCKSCEDVQRLQAENAKLNAIIDGYQPKIQALKVENAELQAYKDVNEDFKTAWEELKAENDRLKELKCKFKEYCTCNTEKYVQCLQEIKEIAETYLTDCQGFKCDAMEEIIQKITKAEEE